MKEVNEPQADQPLMVEMQKIQAQSEMEMIGALLTPESTIKAAVARVEAATGEACKPMLFEPPTTFVHSWPSASAESIKAYRAAQPPGVRVERDHLGRPNSASIWFGGLPVFEGSVGDVRKTLTGLLASLLNSAIVHPESLYDPPQASEESFPVKVGQTILVPDRNPKSSLAWKTATVIAIRRKPHRIKGEPTVCCRWTTDQSTHHPCGNTWSAWFGLSEIRYDRQVDLPAPADHITFRASGLATEPVLPPLSADVQALVKEMASQYQGDGKPFLAEPGMTVREATKEEMAKGFGTQEDLGPLPLPSEKSTTCPFYPGQTVHCRTPQGHFDFTAATVGNVYSETRRVEVRHPGTSYSLMASWSDVSPIVWSSREGDKESLVPEVHADYVGGFGRWQGKICRVIDLDVVRHMALCKSGDVVEWLHWCEISRISPEQYRGLGTNVELWPDTDAFSQEFTEKVIGQFAVPRAMGTIQSMKRSSFVGSASEDIRTARICTADVGHLLARQREGWQASIMVDGKKVAVLIEDSDADSRVFCRWNDLYRQHSLWVAVTAVTMVEPEKDPTGKAGAPAV